MVPLYHVRHFFVDLGAIGDTDRGLGSDHCDYRSTDYRLCRGLYHGLCCSVGFLCGHLYSVFVAVAVAVAAGNSGLISTVGSNWRSCCRRCAAVVSVEDG